MITDKQLEEVRIWLIENVMEDAEIMFSDDIRDAKPDLVEVVASLYELLHREVTGQSYNYMFHWANKIGAWVENDHIFTDMLEDKKQNDASIEYLEEDEELSIPKAQFEKFNKSCKKEGETNGSI